jgi:hypothetical protein
MTSMTTAEIAEIERRAHQMRAEAFAGFMRAFARWVARRLHVGAAAKTA